MAAMRDIPAPPGFRRIKVPEPTRNRSIVYDHGVRFEEDRDKPDPKKQKWFCASSGTCREASLKGQGAILHHDAHTGNVTRHLRQVHGERRLAKRLDGRTHAFFVLRRAVC